MTRRDPREAFTILDQLEYDWTNGIDQTDIPACDDGTVADECDVWENLDISPRPKTVCEQIHELRNSDDPDMFLLDCLEERCD